MAIVDFCVLLHPVGLVLYDQAPVELPQIRKEARVNG